MKRLLIGVLAAALCGCCSVKVCTEGGHDLVEIENEGWKLFGLLAIASGDPEYPNQEVCIWFCDSVILDVNMMLLDETLRRNGYRSFKNVSSYVTKEDAFLFVLKRHVYHTSAELIR